MPASAGITTRDFMCFIIFWIISLPLIWPPVHTMYVAQPSFRKDHWRTCNSRHFFTFKTIVTPIACLVFMIWCIVKAKGVGPIINQPGTLHGSELAWSMMVGISVCISNMITLTTYARRFLLRAYPYLTLISGMRRILGRAQRVPRPLSIPSSGPSPSPTASSVSSA